MPVENPFWGYEAEDFTPEEAVTRFVPNRIWDEVRQPENQLLLGAHGTGKSIVLKRLSYSAMKRAAIAFQYAKAEAFLSQREFLGIYIDVREIAFLNNFGSSAEPNYDLGLLPTPEEQTIISERATSLVLAKETLQELMNLDPTSWPEATKALVRELPNFLNLKDKNINTVEKLRSAIARELEYFRQYLVYGRQESILPQKNGRSLTLLSTARTIAELLKQHLAPPNWKIVFLIDQYDRASAATRKVLSSMLLRYNKKHFRAIIAARPYTLLLDTPNGRLVHKEDFVIRLVEYLPNEHKKYASLLKSIVSRLLSKAELNHLSPMELLPQEPQLTKNDLERASRELGIRPEARENLKNYIGFGNLAALSGGSIRTFLNICADCVSALPSPDRLIHGGVSPATQLIGIAHASRDQEDRISGIQEYPNAELIKTAKKILSKSAINSADEGCPGNPKEIRISSEKSSDKTLLTRIHNLLTAGFRDGAFQYCHPKDVGLQLPMRFRISPILIPLLGASHRTDGFLRISPGEFLGEVRQALPRAKETHCRSSKSSRRTELTSIFLSTAFTSTDDDQKLLKNTFSEKNVNVVIGEALGLGQLETIFHQIMNTQLTLADITNLRPNVVLEMGMSLALTHRVIPIINISRKGISELDLNAYPWIKEGYLEYSFSKPSLEGLRNAVMVNYPKFASPHQTLEKSAHSGKALRTKKPRAKHLYIYHPEEIRGLWGLALDQISSICNHSGYTIVNNRDDRLDEIERHVWSIARASDVLIDTSGKTNPDLQGCFLLGFSYGLKNKRHIIRVEAEGLDHGSGLSMWPTDSEKYATWHSAESQLPEIIKKLLPL